MPNNIGLLSSQKKEFLSKITTDQSVEISKKNYHPFTVRLNEIIVADLNDLGTTYNSRWNNLTEDKWYKSDCDNQWIGIIHPSHSS